MVTFAQAQERAEEWINGDVPSYQHREVRVREFELGFVVWAEDRADGPRSDGGGQRLVIARDSGEATLWPALPVGEVIRRYEEEYGRPDAVDEPAAAPAARVDLNQTSFLLTPPEWLQEAADRLGIPDRRGGDGDGDGGEEAGPGPDSASAPGPEPVPAPSPAASRPAAVSGGGAPGAPGSGAAWPAAPAQTPAGATPWAGTDITADAGDDRSVPLPETVFAPPLGGAEDASPPAVTPDAKTALMSGGSQLPPTALVPAAEDPGAPGPVGGSHGAGPAGTPPAGVSHTPPPGVPGGPGGPGAPPPTQGGVPYGHPQGPGGAVPGTPSPSPGVPGTPPAGVPRGSTPPPAQGGAPAAPGGTPQRPLPPNAGDIADAATSKAAPPPRRGAGPVTPPPPGAPGAPGAAAGGYVPTQFVSAPGPEGREGGAGAGQGGAQPPHAPGAPQPPGAPSAPGAPNAPGGTPPGGVHHATTMFADPARVGPGAPGVPQPPGPPGAPGMPGAPGAQGTPGGARGPVHHAETVLSAPPVGPPAGPPGTPLPPQAPGVPGMPGAAPPTPPGAVPPPGQPVPGRPLPGQPVPGQPLPGQPPAYGHPQQPAGLPTVGPGYQAVLRYRAQDGSEQQLIRRSAPGTPHPEWQIFHELRAMNVPPDQVLELHTELESCELPGAYCARMIREQWPQARITSIAPYGTDHASRQQGMRELLAHQGELHQVADGPARPAPVRAPLPPVHPAPPIPPEGIAQELGAAFGPGIFRFEQAAVSRQGVPPIVAHTLVVAGLPVDMGPFFWAQAQPGRPVPTLAELAAERGVQPAPDAGSYLVVGSDFGKALCVQYGTANIVAVPVEAGPGGAPVPPQFVNTGLPEFARCLALLGRMWRLRFGLNQEQAGRWTVDFQAQLAALDPAALGSPESWWSVLLEQMWDGLL
ncbi:SUKH-4 family immunity protein [Streptomyces sp. NPDC052701]|uniref:SUKH-4 family immunity protein n=1 Tax=Streptomyces sp. NPDC052701 TaxID=3155533 RepID=UPI00344A9ADC